MKKFVLCLAVLLLSSAALPAHAAEAKMLKISSTIGPVEAGIIPLLAETFTKNTGIVVSYEKAGTGATLEKAKTGNFDMVVVHAKKLEDAFIAEGFGIDRRDIMYNDFVILGPKNDPAGIKGEKSVVKAFQQLAAQKALTVTRGDKSGTHVKEMDIWNKAGLKPAGDWYCTFADGAKGNKATTLYAGEKNAYVLMDRATWLTLKKDSPLALLVEGDPLMLNLIAIIRVNPDKFPGVNAAAAQKFADWLESAPAQDIIKNFKVAQYGEPLFFPNAKKH